MPTSQPDSARVAAIVSRYGSREKLLETFHVNRQERLTRLPGRCITGTAPTLADANRCYGDGTAQEWLVYELADLSEFCGARDKITPAQLRQTAQLVATDYGWLKLSEVMLFMRRFKLGRYGRFYGAVDPLVIMSALHDFIGERAQVLEAEAARRSEAEWQAWKESERMTYEEYRRRKADSTNQQTQQP